MDLETRLAHAGRDPDRQHGAVNPPIYRASTIVYPTMAEFQDRPARKYTGFGYGIDGTPTTFALAEAVAELSGGHRTLVLSSGLAAATHALTAFVRQGDHVLVSDALYGPTRLFCTDVLRRFGVDVTFYDPLAGAGIAELIQSRTRVIYLESPGSHSFEVQDVPAVARVARERGVVTVLDNTWATPINFRAFEHGVDVEVQAGTKYLAGHSDLLVGLLTARDETGFRSLRDAVVLSGDCTAPDVCYEALRGLRTLGVRMRRHAESTLAVARWLSGQLAVARVLYPALADDPGHALWRRDFRGASSLFGVLLRTADERAVAALLDGLRVFRIGASFGGFESLAYVIRPVRAVRPWTEPGVLLRLHVGLEAVADLIADLEAGFDRLRAVTGEGAA